MKGEVAWVVAGRLAAEEVVAMRWWQWEMVAEEVVEEEVVVEEVEALGEEQNRFGRRCRRPSQLQVPLRALC